MALDFLPPSAIMNASNAFTFAPPPYPLPPCYTLDARPDERVLSLATRRARPRANRARTQDTTKSAFCSVALHGARDGGGLPAYGRGDVLDGSITLTSTKRVTSVSVTLEGKMKCAAGDAIADFVVFVSDSYTLWDAQSSAPLYAPHSFSIPLPAMFDDNGTTRALPASFAFSDGEFSASVKYRLVVCVAARRAFLPKIAHTRRLVIPITYKPRLRLPHAPLSQSTTLLETLKVAPDEWTSVALGVFPVASKSQLWQPVKCEVAFPASRVFSAGETIPIHFQATGDARALAALASAHPALTLKSLAPTWNLPSHLATEDGLPSYASVSEYSRPGSSCTMRSHLTSSSSATLVTHPEPKTAKSRPTASLSVSALLERRIALLGPLGTAYRTQVLGAASLHLAHHEGWLALDGALPVPDDAALSPDFRIGALRVVDSLVFVVSGDGSYRSAEKRVPVVIVNGGFFYEEGHADEVMEL